MSGYYMDISRLWTFPGALAGLPAWPGAKNKEYCVFIGAAIV